MRACYSLLLIALEVASADNSCGLGPNAVACGCFSSAEHACDCTITSKRVCNLKRDHRWSQDCHSCHPEDNPAWETQCGRFGNGQECGCYFLRSPESVAGKHSCACQHKTRSACEAVAGPFQGIWTEDCSSCYEDPPDLPLHETQCGEDGQGTDCGCYILNAPDAVAKDHTCRCDIHSKSFCENMKPGIGFWSDGCTSCYPERRKLLIN